MSTNKYYHSGSYHLSTVKYDKTTKYCTCCNATEYSAVGCCIEQITSHFHTGKFHEAYGSYGDIENYWTCCGKSNFDDIGCNVKINDANEK